MIKRISAYLRLMRFHKPVGIWLLLFPALWALWAAGEGKPHIKNVIIFIAGSVIMRAAGCVINDIADKDFDKHVKRTASRPLASGDIKTKPAALLFLALIMFAGILVFNLNKQPIILALISLGLACFYPLSKRFINCPQLFLGLAFAMTVPMAFAAELNYLNLDCALMYLIAVIWPLMYDTEYALADKEDDLKIRLKSTAILFGKHVVVIIGLLQTLIIVLLSILGICLKLENIYFICVILVSGLFSYQLYLIKDEQPEKCFRAFLNNQWVGLGIFMGFFIPRLDLYWDELTHFFQ